MKNLIDSSMNKYERFFGYLIIGAAGIALFIAASYGAWKFGIEVFGP